MNHIKPNLIRKNKNLSKREDSLKVWGGHTTTPSFYTPWSLSSSPFPPCPVSRWPQALAEMLKKNTTLLSLYLYFNDIGDSGAEAPRQGSWRIGCRAVRRWPFWGIFGMFMDVWNLNHLISISILVGSFLGNVWSLIFCWVVFGCVFECVALKWDHRIDPETLARGEMSFVSSKLSKLWIMLLKLTNSKGNVLEIRADGLSVSSSHFPAYPSCAFFFPGIPCAGPTLPFSLPVLFSVPTFSFPVPGPFCQILSTLFSACWLDRPSSCVFVWNVVLGRYLAVRGGNFETRKSFALVVLFLRSCLECCSWKVFGCERRQPALGVLCILRFCLECRSWQVFSCERRQLKRRKSWRGVGGEGAAPPPSPPDALGILCMCCFFFVFVCSCGFVFHVVLGRYLVVKRGNLKTKGFFAFVVLFFTFVCLVFLFFVLVLEGISLWTEATLKQKNPLRLLFCSCVFVWSVVLGRCLAVRGGNLKKKEAGGGLGGRSQRLPSRCIGCPLHLAFLFGMLFLEGV